MLFLLVVCTLVLFGNASEVADTVQDVSQTLNNPEEIGNISNSMQSGFSLALFVAVPFVLVSIWVAVIYNGLVNKEEAVFES